MKKSGLLLGLILTSFILYTFISTGYFRQINNENGGLIVSKIMIKGAEDIIISPDETFAIISATNRASISLSKPPLGDLYYLNLLDEYPTPIKLTDSLSFQFAPHGIDLLQIDDSTYQILAINHINKRHSIEKFHLKKQKLIHLASIRHSSMIQPNDVVHISQNAFYFTNDHRYTQGLMKIIEEYSGWGLSNVVFSNENKFREVASGIAYANGIAYDQKRQLVFVASPRHFSVRVYQYQKNGNLVYVESIACGTGVDNLTLDKNGKIWIGAHPNLLRFSAYAKGKYATTPSEIIVLDYRAKGDYTVKSIWTDNGERMSGGTVAVPYPGGILAGNVMDDHFLILENPTEE